MPSAIQSNANGFFLDSLQACRSKPLCISFPDAAKLAKKKGAVLFEKLEEGPLYTAFTDCDHYCDTIDIPSDDYIDDVFERMMDNLAKLINHQLDDSHKGTFGMATRHGVHVEKGVYKLSWRCYFFGFVITLSDMKKAIVNRGLDRNGIGSLDSSPYNKNQLLGCVGFCKSKTDKRVLVPCDNSLPLEKFMVQNTTGKEVFLKYDNELDVSHESLDECEDEEDETIPSSRFAPPWKTLELAVMSLNVEKRCGRESYPLWIRVAWGIAGVARVLNRFQDGLELWLRFCRRDIMLYRENPLKARTVYLYSKKKDQQLGWRSLFDALKGDNPRIHADIKRKLAVNSSKLERQKKTTNQNRNAPAMTILSEREAKKLAFEMMTTNDHIPSQVNLDGVSVDNIEKCHHGWNCNLPKNRWINDQEISGRGGGIDLLLGQLGLQLVNVQSDPHNPWPKDGWLVDREKLTSVLSHVSFSNCVFNIDNSTNKVVNPQNILSDGRTILPCDFDHDGLEIFSDRPQIRTKFLLSLSGLHNAVAKYFYATYKDRFRCIGTKWFEFLSHIWDIQDENDIITAVLSSEEFLMPYVTALQHYEKYPSASNVDSKRKCIDSLLRNLQSGPFKSNVFGECRETFRYNHRNFAKTIDRAYLTPFSNGVLDLKTLEFRDGRPDDNMTKSMQVDYIPYDPEAPTDVHQRILDWFVQVQPNQDQRNYLQKLIGLFLTPDTNLQKVFVFSGIGSNGKSFFLENILHPAMGTFYKSGPTALLTGKREKANETNEAIVNLVGARVAVFLEPDGDETIQADILKLMSGGDEMSVRALHSKQMSFKPTFKTVVVCNNKPKLSEDTFAIWRRIRVIHWPVTFVHNPDADNPYEAKLDPLLEEKVKLWPPFFVGLMVYWLQQYRLEGLVEPDCVLQQTQEYKEEHDEWKAFRDTHLRRKTSDVCGSVALKACFRAWFKEHFSDSKLPTDKTITMYFEKHLGSKVKNNHLEKGGTLYGWKGWTLLNVTTTAASSNFVPES